MTTECFELEERVADSQGELCARPRDWSSAELRHDLRQPLSAVSLMVDTVLASTDLPVETQVTLARIREQTDWMVQLLRSAEASEPELAFVDLAEVVEGPCLATPTDVSYDVRLVAPRQTGVVVDPVGLTRTVWNLVDNARRAVACGGMIEVRVHQHRHQALLEVADSGPGFGRLPLHEGHGLVAARRFARRHGGELCLGGSSLGGALVTLRLPLASGRPESCGP